MKKPRLPSATHRHVSCWEAFDLPAELSWYPGQSFKASTA